MIRSRELKSTTLRLSIASSSTLGSESRVSNALKSDQPEIRSIFEFEISENYGEPLPEGTYKVKHDIYNLDGDIVINMNESVEFTETTDTIMGYDVFKYNDVYLTTEDLYA